MSDRDKTRNLWAALTAILTLTLLTVVQIVVDPPILLAERFSEGGGWIQIAIISILSGVLYIKMYDRRRRSHWRRMAWRTFAIVFFAQLILGLTVDTFFLMTGKLHLPVPLMIIGGAIYRWEFAFMAILFVVTVILSGPAWCSQLCYFGAFDSMAADAKRVRQVSISSRKRLIIRQIILAILIISAIGLRFLPPTVASVAAVGAALIGVGVILFFSRGSGRMVHCTTFCPLGVAVSWLKWLSPFRLKINEMCTKCQQCKKSCKYGALAAENIARRKPDAVCTMCGDCLSACRHGAIEYRFGRLNATTSERLWLLITIVLLALFVAVARI